MNMRLDVTFVARHSINPRLHGQRRVGARLAAVLFFFAMGSGLVPIASPIDPTASAADPTGFGSLATEYEQDIQPLLRQFCLECHTQEAGEGELDLEQFATLSDVRRKPQLWVKVVEMITIGEMPQKDAEQPLPGQRVKLLAWAQRYLHAEALAGAGDPGPVVLRRLNNSEYTYTVGDLTQVPLDPARQFPTEGAAGEGFTNTGNALVLSPSLIRKYLDAGKQIASHAVLLPRGFRFSPHVTRRDWTDELLAEIREFYQQFCRIEPLESHYGHASTPLGNAGRLPLEKYLAVTLSERDALMAGDSAIGAVAAEHGLQAGYLRLLWSQLNAGQPSILLDELRSRWRTAAPGDAPALAAWVKDWQQGVWIFNPVGLVGSKGNQDRWLEPVNPLLTEQELRLPLPTSEGRSQAYVAAAYQRERPKTAEYLAACASLQRRVAVAEGIGRAIIDDEAISRDLESDVLVAWLKYLGIWHKEERAVLPGGMLEKFEKDFDGVKLQGWGYATLPWIFANQSAVEVTAPAVPVGALVVQPSPNQPVAVGWRCPSDMEVEVEVHLSDAYKGSADGVRWSVEVSRHGLRKELQHGICDDGGSSGAHLPSTPQQRRWLKLRRGDWLALILDVIADYHGDNYLVELTIRETSGEDREWDLVKDVANDIQSGNPHVDSYGDPSWSFIALRKKSRPGEILPWLLPDSALAQWYAAVADSAQESNLEERTQHLAGMLAGAIPPEINPPDAVVVEDYASADRGLWALIEPTHLNPDAQKKVDDARASIAKIENTLASLSKVDFAMGAQEGGVPKSQYEGIHDTRMHKRGDYNHLGGVVARDVPQILKTGSKLGMISGSGRLELAKWLGDASNPLTARVIVNRIWQYHFGRGIVETSNNFGKLGTPPSHPELLDYLAAQFVKTGWSFKSMHRLIMNTRTYQQSSQPGAESIERDPDNKLLGRAPRRRLEAEAIRDAMLFVAGNLDISPGGPPLAELSNPRRTLYLASVRSDVSSYPRLFDAADNTSIVGLRDESTVAPMSLFMMNHPFVRQQAEALAERLKSQAGISPEKMINFAYETLYARRPTPAEMQIGVLAIADGKNEALADYCHILLSTNEFVYVH